MNKRLHTISSKLPGWLFGVAFAVIYLTLGQIVRVLLPATLGWLYLPIGIALAIICYRKIYHNDNKNQDSHLTVHEASTKQSKQMSGVEADKILGSTPPDADGPGVYCIRIYSHHGKKWCVYVGQSKNILDRWSMHKMDLMLGEHHCIPLQNAFFRELEYRRRKPKKFELSEIVRFDILQCVPSNLGEDITSTLQKLERFYWLNAKKYPFAIMLNEDPYITDNSHGKTNASKKVKSFTYNHIMPEESMKRLYDMTPKTSKPKYDTIYMGDISIARAISYLEDSGNQHDLKKLERFESNFPGLIDETTLNAQHR